MKILLIEDHSLFRDGMQLALSVIDGDIHIFNASSYEEALPLMDANPDLDLILLDMGLPGLSGEYALQAIREGFPSIPVVVVSGNSDGNKVRQILDMGAQGYIPKSTGSNLLRHALKLVLSGGVYIPPEILFQHKMERHTELYTSGSENSSVSRNALTPRQLDVLQKMARGQSNKVIAAQLELAEATVRAHVAAIFKTLNANNRTQAVHIAIKNGWIVGGSEV